MSLPAERITEDQVQRRDAELEQCIAKAYDDAMAALDRGDENGQLLWNEYLALRARRSPERVAQLDAERLERARNEGRG